MESKEFKHGLKSGMEKLIGRAVANPNIGECPSDEEIYSYSRDRMSGEPLRNVTSHLSRCGECQTVAQMMKQQSTKREHQKQEFLAQAGRRSSQKVQFWS